MKKIITFILCLNEKKYIKPNKYLIQKIIKLTEINFFTINTPVLTSTDIKCSCGEYIDYINKAGEIFCKNCYIGITFIWNNITAISMGNHCYNCDNPLNNFFLNGNLYCEVCILKTSGNLYYVNQETRIVEKYFLPRLIYNKQCERCLKYKKKIFKCKKCALFICNHCLDKYKYCEHKISKYELCNQ